MNPHESEYSKNSGEDHYRQIPDQDPKRSFSLLRATLESTADGILVVDQTGRIVTFNDKFVQMWQIPDGIIESRDDAKALAFVLDQLRDPDEFLKKVQELYKAPDAESFDILHFKDQRVFERYSQPQQIEGKSVGRVWSFRDITARTRSELVQRAMYRISEATVSAGSLGDLFASIHAIVGEFIYAKNFYIAIYDPVDERMTFPYFVDEFDAVPQPRSKKRGLTEYVLHTGRPLLARQDQIQELEKRGEIELIGTPPLDWLGVPLRTPEHTIGVLVVQNYTAGVRYGKQEKDMLIFVSEQVAMAIERKRSEQALIESEERYRRFFEEDLAGYFISTPEGRLLSCNHAFVRLFGFASQEEAMNANMNSVYNTREEREQYLAWLMRERRVQNVRRQMIRKDGRIIHTISNIAGEFDKLGKLVRIKGHIIDDTERKEAEIQLTLLAQALRSSGDCISITDMFNNVMFVNDAFQTTYGYAQEEIVGKPVTLVRAPSASISEDVILPATLSGGWKGELVNRRKDGTEFPVFLTTSLVRDEHGTPIAMIGAARDITEQKRAEEELLESNQLNSEVISNATEGIVVLDRNLFYIVWNRYMEQWTGLPPKEVIGKPAADAIPELGEQTIVQLLERALQGERSTSPDVYYEIPKLGRTGWFVGTYGPFRNTRGEIVGVIGLMRDISERRRSEEQLQEQAALLDEARDAISARDLNGRILYWNKGAETLYGWTANEVLGKNAHDLVYGSSGQQWIEPQQIALQKGEWSGELQQKRKDGKEIIVQSRWTLVRDESGKPSSILVVNSDITEKKKLEQQFLRAQRLESIGTLAGGIAHDLNNVLSPILLGVQSLVRKIHDERARQTLSLIEASAIRGGDLVKQVLTFARGIEGERITLHLPHLISDIKKIANQTFPKSVNVVSWIAKDTWTINGDPTQIHQVLLNLCVNARDAMPHGGTLTISTTNVLLDEQYAHMNPEAHAGPHVVLEVADTGVGIPHDVLNRVFEPFFTTKEVGKGTGLGLSTALGIVRGHNGFISVESKVGSGTSFKVYLPASDSVPLKAPAEGVGELKAGNGELILLADDEFSIREITRETLEADGYKALTARDGAEAVALFAQHAKEIKVTLVDMMMPVMDGVATIRALRKFDPTCRIVASSGLASKDTIPEDVLDTIQAFLPKPYTAERLLKTLSDVIAK